MKRLRTKSLLVVGALALGGVGVVTVAAAAVHAGTIHACVAKSDGALRVVKHTSSCSHSEKPLSFNAQGPQGLQGPPGTAGTSASGAFQMYANLDAEADLGSNVDAVSASRIGPGQYQVVFNQPIGKCAAVAQAGQAGGTDPIFPLPSAVSFDAANPNAWDLEFVDGPTRKAIDTAFMLTVTCGAS